MAKTRSPAAFRLKDLLDQNGGQIPYDLAILELGLFVSPNTAIRLNQQVRASERDRYEQRAGRMKKSGFRASDDLQAGRNRRAREMLRWFIEAGYVVVEETPLGKVVHRGPTWQTDGNQP